MSKKCQAYSESKLGLEPGDNRKAFYAGWDAAIKHVRGDDTSEKRVDESDKHRHVHVSGVPYPVDLSDGGNND